MQTLCITGHKTLSVLIWCYELCYFMSNDQKISVLWVPRIVQQSTSLFKNKNYAGFSNSMFSIVPIDSSANTDELSLWIKVLKLKLAEKTRCLKMRFDKQTHSNLWDYFYGFFITISVIPSQTIIISARRGVGPNNFDSDHITVVYWFCGLNILSSAWSKPLSPPNWKSDRI
jgi:hypothetical protein